MSHVGMTRHRCQLVAAVLAALLACLTLGWNTAAAEEPVDQFLAALRAREMHDTVILYLESLKAAGNLPEELRDRVDYEVGLAHLEQAKTISDPARQVLSLGAAQAAFDQFVQAQPKHPQALDARMQLGVVKLWRGRNVLRLAERGEAAEQAARNAEARQLFGEAEKIFIAAHADAEEAIKRDKFKVMDSSQKALIAERNAIQDAIVRSLIYDAESSVATADSYPAGSKEREAGIRDAGKKYVAIATSGKYPENTAGGFLARRGSAECHLALGNKAEALTIYRSLIEMPDVGDYVRSQQTLLLPKILELLCDEETADYQAAITMGENWLTAVRGPASETPTGLAVHYWVAQAQNKKIDEIQANSELKDSAEGKREIRELGEKLIKHVELVASRRGEHQRKSRDLLIAYRGEEDVVPTTFMEARDRGQSALDYFQELIQPSESELTPEETAQREAEEQQALADAIANFRLALSFGSDNATIDEINYTRYYLCYSLFHHRDYYEAAVVGEFIARKQPTFELAQTCSQLALEAYRQIYFADNRGDREFQTQQLEKMAALIGKQWPNSPDADAAWMLLADLSIAASDYPQATEYLDRISPESPRKGLAILKSGQAIWGQYAAKSRPEAEATKEELDALLAQAEAGLSDGVEKARTTLPAGQNAPYELLAAELSLAQLYSRSERNQQSVELLLRPGGVMASLKSGLVGGSPQFPQIAYRTALRCFVQAGNMDAALDVMEELNARAADDADAQRELTGIYLSLGNDLSEQLKTLQSDPNKRGQLAKVADGFRGVLEQIAANPKGAAFNEVFWVANTYTTLGQTLTELDADKSRDCFERAGALYERLIADPNVEERFQNPLRVRLAESYRNIGSAESLQKGINLLLAALNTNENLVDAQQEACLIFERWGDVNNQATFYDLAINGYQDPKSKRQLVWGWGAFAAKVQRSEAYREKYHLARLNVAECRFKKAMAQSGEDRQKTLQQAKGDIAVTYRIGDPSLGGDTWKPQYDSLLKKIQRELQEPAIGLKALDSNSP